MSFVEEEEEEYNPNNNYCVHCGLNMGNMNDRQLCGKTFCYGRLKVLNNAKVVHFISMNYLLMIQE